MQRLLREGGTIHAIMRRHGLVGVDEGQVVDVWHRLDAVMHEILPRGGGDQGAIAIVGPGASVRVDLTQSGHAIDEEILHEIRHGRCILITGDVQVPLFAPAFRARRRLPECFPMTPELLKV